MSHPNPSTALARVVVDELIAHDVELVVISPGSRSAALAIAAAEHPDIRTVVNIDERSAGFRALGYTKAGGRAAVVSTSGTAAANYLPAVVEADMSCVPLVVITADRPAELQGVGANQTIDQRDLFGEKVRAKLHIEALDDGSDLNWMWRNSLSETLSLGTALPPGPVHVNVAFREPTVPVADDGRTRASAYEYETPRIARSGLVDPVFSDPPRVPGSLGVIVAGDGDYDRGELWKRSRDLGWPILATALSGMRGREVVTTYHHLLDVPRPEVRPDVAVVVGAVGPSEVLERFISEVEHQIRVDRWGRINDPSRSATEHYQGEIGSLLRNASEAPDGWREQWMELDLDTRSRLDLALAGGEVSGAAVARSLGKVTTGPLVVASSLPIREVDAHFVASSPVYANRGASGIDGFVSTAVGIADRAEETVALCGDLSLLHDANGLLTEDLPDLVIVVLDNGGGGLFDSLPLATHAPSFERLFITPPRRDFSRLADFHGIRFEEISSPAEIEDVIPAEVERGGLCLVRVEIDRERDLAMRNLLSR